jgi:hypothetical protein
MAAPSKTPRPSAQSSGLRLGWITNLLIGAAVLVTPGPVLGQYALVLRSGEAYEIKEVQIFLVNGKDSGRIWPGKAGDSGDPKGNGKLRQEKFSAANCLRKSDDGLLIHHAGSEWVSWIPELKSKDQGNAAERWAHAEITYKKSKQDKEATPLPWPQLQFLVPTVEGADALERLSSDFTQFTWPGRSPMDAFWDRQRLRAAIVKTYPTSAAAGRIHDSFQQSLALYLTTWDRGGRPATYLETALNVGAASTIAFPNDAALQKLTSDLRSRKALLDRRIAVLSSLEAGEQCDGYLIRYLDFEPFDASFPKLADARRTCYQQSAAVHLENAKFLAKKKNFAVALAELRIARQRQPDSEDIEREQESLRIAAARIASAEAASKGRKPDPFAPEQVQLRRHLQLAQSLLNDGKKAEAIEELKRAEASDPSAPDLLLMQARLAQNGGELVKAIAFLDRYEASGVTAEQFTAGDQLRTSIVYDLEKRKHALQDAIKADFSQQRFLGALQGSVSGLQLDPDNGEFLYYGGINAAILRKAAQGKGLIERYLKVSDSRSGDPKERRSAMNVLSMIDRNKTAAQPASNAQRSWFSGGEIPEGVFYDPLSLAFQPKVASVKASKKLKVTFSWNRSQLVSVVSKFEDAHTGMNIFSAVVAGAAAASGGVGTMVTQGIDSDTSVFQFTYYDKEPQVLRVSTTREEYHGGSSTSSISAGTTTGGVYTPGTTSTVSQGQDEEWQNSNEGFLTLLNNPRVDPDIARAATGVNITTGFSGNAYFHPFVWDGIHLFDLFYDSEGRIAFATEHGKTGRLEFSWDGRKLMKVIKREGSQSNAQVTYSRTLSYAGNKLILETIEFRGRSSKITYKYDKQDKLIEAECSEDLSLDSRSRTATFL